MQYFISFLEGVITFISPCLLPMLPVYVSYFAGGDEKRHPIVNALGFVLGFTLVFVIMGAFAGSLGMLIKRYQRVVNILCGCGVIFFGLTMLEIFHLPMFKGINSKLIMKKPGFVSSILFGMIFSIGWTPCVGAFLGSALLMASSEGSVMEGIVMLLMYSLGLGVPFVASAILIDKVKVAFDAIKKHYRAINIVSGLFLIATGIFIATGIMGKMLTLMSF